MIGRVTLSLRVAVPPDWEHSYAGFGVDETPQLWNILKGDMSFVGPRPLLPIDQPTVTKVRLSVSPGITGWAQINGGRRVGPEAKGALDEWYVKNASFWLDIRIILRTISIVLFGDGFRSTRKSRPRAVVDEHIDHELFRKAQGKWHVDPSRAVPSTNRLDRWRSRSAASPYQRVKGKA